MKLLVTGGAGVIGSAVIRRCLENAEIEIINLDKLTYASSEETLRFAENNPRYTFEHADICDGGAVRRIMADHRPDAVMHLAAETHVDRSIGAPAEFIETNIIGTYNMLESAYAYWQLLPAENQQAFRFHHVSTDEVYGSLGATGLFSEVTPYSPNSPYSASKASADHLVRAWHHTYGLPVVVTNCSNNFGPYQFPEKLIPLMILKAIEGEPIPIYGKGDNVRDWLFVDDHADALITVLRQGALGETYNIGGDNERTNLDIAQTVCRILDDCLPKSDHAPHENLITFVADRPGHDQRYAIDSAKIRNAFGWKPAHAFEDSLRKTVRWYLDNRDWCVGITDKKYSGERLGLEHGNNVTKNTKITKNKGST